MLALRITLIATLILALSACAGGGGNSNKGGSSTESPRILSVPSTAATVGAIYRYDCTAIGTPSPTLSFSGLPSWMMSDSRTIWGTPQAQRDLLQSARLRARRSFTPARSFPIYVQRSPPPESLSHR